MKLSQQLRATKVAGNGLRYWVRCVQIAIFAALLARCPFSAGASRVVSEEEFSVMMRSGENITNITIPGQWLAQGLFKLTNSPRLIKLKDVVITNDFVLSGKNVNKGSGHKTKLLAGLDCGSCEFKGRVEISDLESDFPFTFGFCEFNGEFSLDSIATPTLIVVLSSCSTNVTISGCTIDRLSLITKMGGALTVRDSTFTQPARFVSGPRKMSSFKDVMFSGGADFSNCNFFDSLFLTRVTSKGLFNLDNAHAKKLHVSGCSFLSDANFSQMNLDGTNVGSFSVAESRFGGTAAFTGSRFVNFETQSFRGSGFTIFERDCFFDSMQCNFLRLSDASFREDVILSDTRISDLLTVTNVIIRGDIQLVATQLPSMGDIGGKQRSVRGVILRNCRLGKKLDLDWSQLPRSVATVTSNSFGFFADSRTWKSLSEAWARAENLEGKNEGFYRHKLALMREGQESSRFEDYLSRMFWGYGLRPFRVLLWFFVTIIVFASIYFRQTQGFGTFLQRTLISLSFSWKTAYRFGFGPQNSRTLPFKIVTAFESILCKVIFICFVQAVANVNPLLHAIVGKLITF